MTEEGLEEGVSDDQDPRESWSLDALHERTVALRRLQRLMHGDPCEGDEAALDEYLPPRDGMRRLRRGRPPTHGHFSFAPAYYTKLHSIRG